MGAEALKVAELVEERNFIILKRDAVPVPPRRERPHFLDHRPKPLRMDFSEFLKPDE